MKIDLASPPLTLTNTHTHTRTHNTHTHTTHTHTPKDELISIAMRQTSAPMYEALTA